jgi:hypothetical protein
MKKTVFSAFLNGFAVLAQTKEEQTIKNLQIIVNKFEMLCLVG